MIISASRRTDIPSFYSRWFFNRIEEGYLLVPNPCNSKMLSRVNLQPEVIDCIVFWTKNPAPMLDKLELLKNYKYYFQFTVNAYGQDMEHNLPALKKRMEIFKQLSDRIGKEKVIWRYDPILTNDKYDISFHREAFAQLAESLHKHTEKCMLGFIDHYPHLRNKFKQKKINTLLQEEIEEMAISFKTTTDRYSGVKLDSCTTKVDLNHLGIPSGCCVDQKLIERITGYPITAPKDKNQRNICNCAESIDIGTYDSCGNGCLYCYAIKGNYNRPRNNRTQHDPDSALMIGQVKKDQIIKNREMKSLRNNQFSLF